MLLCLLFLISLTGVYTISTDELLQEEGGHGWPRSRQPVHGYSLSERRFPESVNGASSSLGWSNGSEVAGHNWWTAPSGVNGLQTAATESFEVEEVPYSSNTKETLRMVDILQWNPY